MAYSRAVRAGDTLGPQTQVHSSAEIQIQKIQAARVPHTHAYWSKLRIGLKLTDDVPQTWHILRFHRIAGRIQPGTVYLNFGLHRIQKLPASCEFIFGLLYVSESSILISGLALALLGIDLFCLSLAAIQPHRRKAEGCGGKDSGEWGHGHKWLKPKRQKYVGLNQYSEQYSYNGENEDKHTTPFVVGFDK